MSLGRSDRSAVRRRGLVAAVAGLVLMSVMAAAGATTSTEYTEHAKLTASDGVPHHGFGEAIAVSGDVAVVGARIDNELGASAGAAYVFMRSGDRWVEDAKLTASDGVASDSFGGSVAVTGETVAVGATQDGSRPGAVYVFVRSGGVWVEQAKLTASDGEPGDTFGISLALTGDTLVVGDQVNDGNGQFSGAAYVFSRSGGVWTEDAKLTPSDATAFAFFGRSVALTPDLLAVGASGDVDEGFDAGIEDPGAVYLFARTEAGWAEAAKLTPSDGVALDEFGHSVALAGDSVVVGSLYHDHQDGTGFGSGSVYIFDRIGEGWVEAVQLGPPSATAFDFGISLGAADDTIVVGTHVSGYRSDVPGSAYLFTRSGGSWVETARLAASDGAPDNVFGYVVALEGATAVVAAPWDDDNGPGSGSAYVFDLSDPVIASRAPVVDADFEFGRTFPSGTVSLTGTVSDDAPVRWVRLAIRDRITRLWLQDDMVSWGSFNRLAPILADPNAVATTWSFELDLPDGTYALSARTKDRDRLIGHIKPWRRFNVGDDFSPPTVDAGFVAGSQFASPVRITGIATDDQAVIRVRVAIRDRTTRLWLQDDRVSWGPFNRFPAILSDPGESSTDWSFEVALPPGDYSLSARATDRLGNEASIRPWHHFSIAP